MNQTPAGKRFLFTGGGPAWPARTHHRRCLREPWPFNTIAAMTISVTKAALIVVFFMEIRGRSPVIWVALAYRIVLARHYVCLVNERFHDARLEVIKIHRRTIRFRSWQLWWRCNARLHLKQGSLRRCLETESDTICDGHSGRELAIVVS